MKNKVFWNWVRDETEPESRTLYLNGVIAEESWFSDEVTPAAFKADLTSGSGPITVWINSVGGDCVAAAQIYNMLMECPHDVTVKIDGIAASAASVIAMAGTRVLMSPTSLLMVHNPFTVAMGDSEEMRKAIQLLDEVKESIINAYAIKTGLSRTKLSNLMDSETWMIMLYDGAVSQAVFSREYENLTSQIYTQSAMDFANTVLIGGEGEGTSRILASIAKTAGEARCEVFVDAKDLRQEDFGAGYPAALLYRGENKLSELSMAHSFDAEVNPHGNLRYKVDFDLGQVVTVLSKKWGVTLSARITEIEESYDASGQTLNIVFGKEALSLLQKLKGG